MSRYTKFRRQNYFKNSVIDFEGKIRNCAKLNHKDQLIFFFRFESVFDGVVTLEDVMNEKGLMYDPEAGLDETCEKLTKCSLDVFFEIMFPGSSFTYDRLVVNISVGATDAKLYEFAMWIFEYSRNMSDIRLGADTGFFRGGGIKAVLGKFAREKLCGPL